MKKFVSGMVALALVVSLCACGSTGSESRGGGSASGKPASVGGAGGGGDTACAEKIRLGLSSNEAVADFVQLNYTQVPEFAKAGALKDVSASFKPYQDELVDGALSVAKYEGKTIAFPFELKPRVWFYRSDIFQKAGVDAAQVKNVDDLIAADKKIQALHPNTYIWNLGPNPSPYAYYLTLSCDAACLTPTSSDSFTASSLNSLSYLRISNTPSFFP